MMDINLELYRVFYYVATSLSFSEASRQLFISQSAVSQSIKALEKKLNLPLFIRSTKKVTLTPEGEALLKHVHPAIQMILQGEELLTNNSHTTGQIRIAASDTICRYFLIDYLKRFHQEYPEIRIKVVSQTSMECVNLLKTEQVDLIICNYPNSYIHPHLKTKIIHEFEDSFVASKELFHNAKLPETLEELTDYPLLMLSPKTSSREYFQQLFFSRGKKLLPEIELNSNDLLLDLAKIGLGITCVPDFMLQNDTTLVKIPLKKPLPKRQLVLVQHETLPLSKAAERFFHYF